MVRRSARSRPWASSILELAPLNIGVDPIHPDFIYTLMTSNLPEDMVTIPLDRLVEMREVSTLSCSWPLTSRPTCLIANS